MNKNQAIELLTNERCFKVEEVKYKYRVSDEDGVFTFDTDEDLINYALEQKQNIF